MDVAFETDERWNFDRGGVIFWAHADGERVRCIVSREAIEDSFGGEGTKEASLQHFRQNRSSFEAEAAALIRSGRTVAVTGEDFKEAQILKTRIRHRPVASPTRRGVEDEFVGSGIAKHAADRKWWSEAARVNPDRVIVFANGGKVGYIDIAFDSEDAASNFDHKMSTFGVRTYRLEPAG